MLYLGIDQHKRQLTVNLRSEDGTVTLQRQVSTQWEKVRAFFADLAEKAKPEGGFLAILEVCGMNPWLLEMLQEYGCREIVVIQPTERSKQKTDRRDAGKLAHLLWVHRQQFLDGKHPLGLRRVQPPTAQEADDRQFTALRARLTKKRTAVLNGIHKILRKHNLEQACPTKMFQTQEGPSLAGRDGAACGGPPGDESALAAMGTARRAIGGGGSEARRAGGGRRAGEAAGIGAGHGALQCLGHRLADRRHRAVQAADSLANFFGLTPGCRNSGEATQRLGSITKRGSKMVRYLLNQAVIKVLRFDGKMRTWFKGIKKRRGSKIARVAVMRRLATILWHMLKKKQKYRYDSPIKKHQEFVTLEGTAA